MSLMNESCLSYMSHVSRWEMGYMGTMDIQHDRAG